MHYRNGREAKVGDQVIKLGGYGSSAEIVAFGVLHSADPERSGRVLVRHAPR